MEAAQPVLEERVDLKQLETDILAFVRRAYPNIEVRVEPWTDDPKRPAIYFTEAQFATLYPAQRYHYLRNLIPADYYDRHLTDTEWFELAPGERPEDLEYPDSELIADIDPDVMRCLAGCAILRDAGQCALSGRRVAASAAMSWRLPPRPSGPAGARVPPG